VCSVIGNQCAQCRADIIAPEWSEHLSDHCVRNVWSCEVCGYRFEDAVYLSRELADKAESDEKILTSDVPDEVL
jgi:ribosomal protein L37AE/L43A